MKPITAEVQNLNTISLRTHLRSSDTVSRHLKNGFVETRGVRRQQKAISFAWRCCGPRHLEGNPSKRLHRMLQGLFALLTWQQTVLGKRLPKHPTVFCPSPHLCGDLWAVLKAMPLFECFCYFAHKVVTAIPHWP